MAGHEAELTAALRARHELAADEGILAAWDARLVHLDGIGDAAPGSAPRAAILGVTETRGYVMCDVGVLGFDLHAVRRAHSPKRGHLRFDVESAAPITVELALAYGAVATAAQLTAMATQAPPGLAARRTALVEGAAASPRAVPKVR